MLWIVKGQRIRHLVDDPRDVSEMVMDVKRGMPAKICPLNRWRGAWHFEQLFVLVIIHSCIYITYIIIVYIYIHIQHYTTTAKTWEPTPQCDSRWSNRGKICPWTDRRTKSELSTPAWLAMRQKKRPKILRIRTMSHSRLASVLKRFLEFQGFTSVYRKDFLFSRF
jgi:hypothetical protein